MKKVSFSKRKRDDIIFYGLVVFLPLVQFFIFWVCVNANSIALAFEKYDLDSMRYTWGGFRNFESVFQNIANQTMFSTSLKNSLLYWVFSQIVALPLTLIFSYYIYKKRFGANFFRVLLFLPSIISSIVLATLFRHFADSAVPALIELFTGEKVLGLLSRPQTVFPSIIAFNIVISFGSGILLYSGTMSSINSSLCEAAQVDGASPLREFLHIVFPMIYPTFLTFQLTGISAIFTFDLNLFSLYGLNAQAQHYTIGYYIYTETLKASYSEYTYLSAYGIVLTAIAVVLMYLIRFTLTKLGPSED